jgi:hypothetical protein
MSIGSLRVSSRPPFSRSTMPLGTSSLLGRSIGGVALKPNRSMYSKRVSSPTLAPTWANQVLTELVSAVSSAIGPQLWLKSLLSSCPSSMIVPGASIVVSGVIVPLSRAAAAVTTLKVEPGG